MGKVRLFKKIVNRGNDWSDSHGKKVRSHKIFQEWPGKKIRLYEFNTRTLFLPPVGSDWHWLTGGLLCLLGRS